jgi:AraC family transcriptional regulator
MLVLRGDVRCDCHYGRFDLRSGSWLAIDAGLVQLTAKAPGALLLALVVDSRLAQWFQDLPESPVFFLGSGRTDRARQQAALRAWRLATMQDADAGDAVARVHRAVCAIQAYVHADVARCPGYGETRKRAIYLRMQRARLRLEGCPDKAVRVSDLAAESGISLWYFSKLFHSLHGMSPQRYAMEVRLSHARGLLATTSMEIADIGAACGFENACSFARAFRGRFGEPASLHRLRSKGQASQSLGIGRPR